MAPITKFLALGIVYVFMFPGIAQAATVFSSGSGSAVTNIDLSADFEDLAALTDNLYIEDSISFSRSNLTFDNNGCGFAGCSTHPGFFDGATPFMGNYMYGAGDGSFTIAATGVDVFTGLEMIIGTGGDNQGGQNIIWETFLNGSSVGIGTEPAFPLDLPGVYGWSDTGGCDKLVFTLSANSPAFDKVRVQLDPGSNPIPAPGSLMLFGLALTGLGMMRRRRVA
jgi:hypothetical protein